MSHICLVFKKEEKNKEGEEEKKVKPFSLSQTVACTHSCRLICSVQCSIKRVFPLKYECIKASSISIKQCQLSKYARFSKAQKLFFQLRKRPLHTSYWLLLLLLHWGQHGNPQKHPHVNELPVEIFNLIGMQNNSYEKKSRCEGFFFASCIFKCDMPDMCVCVLCSISSHSSSLFSGFTNSHTHIFRP